MDVIKNFLESEINSQELYTELMEFITSFHIRNGEFEGNEFVVKKMDDLNFIIFPEYKYSDGHKEIHAATSLYKNNLIDIINKHMIDCGLSKEKLR